MSNGASYVHMKIRGELENYIKAQYFAKHFWNKTPDELMIVAEDMRQSYCSNFGEYIEKGMRGNTISQIKEVREIKEAIPEVQERKNKITRTIKEIDWWD